MCMLFVLVDIGRPDRVWHLIPFVGSLNLPSSLLAWDVLVLNGYLVLNLVIVTHLLYTAYHRRPYRSQVRRSAAPVLDPGRGRHPHRHRLRLQRHRGPTVLELVDPGAALPRLGLLLGPGDSADPVPDPAGAPPRIQIKDEAIWKIAELMAYAMFLNLFLFGAEIFREYYSDDPPPHPHPVPLQRCSRPQCSRSVRLGVADLQRDCLSAVPDPGYTP